MNNKTLVVRSTALLSRSFLSPSSSLLLPSSSLPTPSSSLLLSSSPQRPLLSFHPLPRRFFSPSYPSFSSIDEKKEMVEKYCTRLKPGMVDLLEKLANDFETWKEKLNSSSLSSSERKDLSKKVSAQRDAVSSYDDFVGILDEIQDGKTMLSEAKELNEKDLIPEIQADIEKSIQQLLEMEDGVLDSLIPVDEHDQRNTILEIRPGTGGKEAQLFALELFRMYQAYASYMGWKFDVMDAEETGEGGSREAVAMVNGDGVFGVLKFESGVHRVQRIPVTESQGRIHTSTVTVAVMPEAEEKDVDINDSDIRIDVYRSSGAGGQHVNTTESAVRVTHIPTNTVVCIQDERSQHKNKAKALTILRARLYEKEREAAIEKRADLLKEQVGTGSRSERIRTYNFPQSRVTDHRCGVTLHNLEKVLAGGEYFDELSEKLFDWNRKNLLQNFLEREQK